MGKVEGVPHFCILLSPLVIPTYTHQKHDSVIRVSQILPSISLKPTKKNTRKTDAETICCF